MRDPAVAAWGPRLSPRVHRQPLALAHVGDSRAYLLRANVLEQLTADHSLVAEQVRHGLMTHEQAETSELQSVLRELWEWKRAWKSTPTKLNCSRGIRCCPARTD